jgi:hypothetical protein
MLLLTELLFKNDICIELDRKEPERSLHSAHAETSRPPDRN